MGIGLNHWVDWYLPSRVCWYAWEKVIVRFEKNYRCHNVKCCNIWMHFIDNRQPAVNRQLGYRWENSQSKSTTKQWTWRNHSLMQDIIYEIQENVAIFHMMASIFLFADDHFFSSASTDMGRQISINLYNSANASHIPIQIWQRHHKLNTIKGSRPIQNYHPTLGPNHTFTGITLRQNLLCELLLSGSTELALRVITGPVAGSDRLHVYFSPNGSLQSLLYESLLLCELSFCWGSN